MTGDRKVCKMQISRLVAGFLLFLVHSNFRLLAHDMYIWLSIYVNHKPIRIVELMSQRVRITNKLCFWLGHNEMKLRRAHSEYHRNEQKKNTVELNMQASIVCRARSWPASAINNNQDYHSIVCTFRIVSVAYAISDRYGTYWTLHHIDFDWHFVCRQNETTNYFSSNSFDSFIRVHGAIHNWTYIYILLYYSISIFDWTRNDTAAVRLCDNVSEKKERKKNRWFWLDLWQCYVLHVYMYVPRFTCLSE